MKLKDNLKDMRSKNVTELTKLLQDQKKELVKITLDSDFGKNKNVAKMGQLKKSIARISTIINETIIKDAIESFKKTTGKSKEASNA